MAETVEITADQLGVFQKGMALLQKLSTDSTTKRDFERVVKKIAPEVETTDDIVAEAARPYVEKIDKLSEQLSTFMTADAERHQRATEATQTTELESRFARLRDKEGLTPEGEAKVRELMIGRNIPDPEAAFALFERNTPKPAQEVAAWEPPSWNLDDTTSQEAQAIDVKGLFADPERWGDRMAGKVLGEMRAREQI